MDLNANFDERVSVHAARIPWKASPMPGVERRMLDRLGDEVARATTIVRYAPDSHFSSHLHTGGEEFFVLDGVSLSGRARRLPGWELYPQSTGVASHAWVGTRLHDLR